MKKISFILFYFAFSNIIQAQSQCTNFDFESTTVGTYTTANAVSGWTISSQTVTSCNTSTVWNAGSPEFAVVNTPISSYSLIGTIPHSPLGGSQIVQLNNLTANSSSTRLQRSISITTLNTFPAFAFAGIWQDGSHACCEQANFKVRFYDCSGNLITCPSFSLAGAGCQYIPSYSITSGSYWTNWQIRYVDLTPYVGSCVTMEIIVSDCTHGEHFGTVFFDAICYDPIAFLGGCFPYVGPPTNTVNVCSGSTIATIDFFTDHLSYNWLAPSGYPISAYQASLSSITVTNALAGNVYTLMLVTNANDCIQSITYTLVNTTLGVAALLSSPSCSLGSSGSATVGGSGNTSGYSFIWLNSTNSVVSSSYYANNLSPGIYSVIVSAAGSQSLACAPYTTTLSVGTGTFGEVSLLKPFCNNEAYLNYPGGSNYQWYNNLTTISASLGGTASSYTVTAPTNGAIYRLTYLSPQGCQDSIKLTLAASTAGNLSISSNPFVCPGATNGLVTLSMTAAPGAPLGSNWFNVSASGTTTAYSVSINPSSLNTFTANNLSSGGTYTVNAFDGICKYGTSFSVTPYVFNYTLSPSNTPTICQGNSIAAAASFTSSSSYSHYTYSWSPSTFLSGTNNYNVIISPSVSAGNSLTLVYTVVVTPTLVNCPHTKTLSLSLINPAIPTINPIPNLCMDSPTFAITSNPSGGTYSSNLSGLLTSGIISPMLSLIGVNNFTYIAPQQYTCAARTSTSSFLVNPQPYINLSGNLTICHGQTSTLSLSGNSNSYTWSNGSTSSSVVVSPSVTTNYSVVGTSSNTCSNYRIYTMTVVPIPSISISGNSICAGSSGTLQASGANTYTWNNGYVGPNLIVPSGSPLNYTVFGANSQTCISSASITLSSLPVPTLSISGNTAICEGQSTTLLANGASTYSWSNSSTSPFTILTPGNTTVISVTGTDALTNCSSVQTLTVKVLPLPQISISGDTLLCVGESITLSASGANSYSWNTGSSTQNITVSPTISTNYSVIGTTANGKCSNARVISIVVSACTGIDKSDLGFSDLKIYPNPSYGNIFLETEHTVQISIFDDLGKLIFQKDLEKGNHSIDLSEYNRGVYLLKISDAHSQKVVKLIKAD